MAFHGSDYQAANRTVRFVFRQMSLPVRTLTVCRDDSLGTSIGIHDGDIVDAFLGSHAMFVYLHVFAVNGVATWGTVALRPNEMEPCHG